MLSVEVQSIFFRQEKRRAFTTAILANCFRYQPNFGPIFETVRTKQPTPIDESLFVGLAVLVTKFAIIPGNVSLQELQWRLPIPLERLQCPWGRKQNTRIKLWFGCG